MSSDAPSRRRLGRVLGLVVVVGVLALLAWAIVRSYGGEPDATAGPESTAAGCARELTVGVATSAEFSPVVLAAVDRLAEADPCTTYTLSTASPAQVAERIRADATQYQVWIPDSPFWVERVNEDPAAVTLTAGPTLATTPVVLAVPSSLAEAEGTTGLLPWADILDGPLRPRLADPGQSTASLLLLTSADRALGGTPEEEYLLGGEIIRMSRLAAPEGTLLLDASNDGEDVTAVVSTEQQISRQRAQNAVTPLEAAVPAEGAGTLSYTWVPLPGPDQGVGMQSALAALRDELTGPDAAADLRASGFRSPEGQDPPDVPGVPAELPPAPPPTTAAANAVLTTWHTVVVDMRMLAVIDVSGSMLQPVGDQTRIALAAGSAEAAMQIFPPTSQVGLWVFSTDHPGGNDWTELAPIAPLTAEHGEGIHRDALLAAASSLPSHPREGDDTGLYDTVLAAYREVQRNYEPGFVNSVVVLTDGVNEDEGSITLDELLAQLQALVDPTKPIPIITVGMGPGADEGVLRLISAQTGGRSYLARDPADISTVFVDALTHRFRVG